MEENVLIKKQSLGESIRKWLMGVGVTVTASFMIAAFYNMGGFADHYYHYTKNNDLTTDTIKKIGIQTQKELSEFIANYNSERAIINDRLDEQDKKITSRDKKLDDMSDAVYSMLKSRYDNKSYLRGSDD